MRVNRKLMEDQLGFVTMAVNDRSLVDVLRHVLITRNGGAFRLTCTDIDTTLHASVPCGDPGEMETLAPARTLYALIRSIESDEISLNTTADNRLVIQGGDHASKLPCLFAQEAPRGHQEEPESPVSLPAGNLLAALRSGGFSAREGSNPESVQLEIHDGRLSISSTDDKNFAYSSVILEGEPGTKMAVHLPLYVVPKIEAMASGASFIQIGQSHSQLHFHDDTGRQITARKIDAPFPPIHSFLASLTDFTTTALVPREALLSTIRRLSIVSANSRSGDVSIWFKPHLAMVAGDPDSGTSKEVIGSAEISGDPEINMRFNLDRLHAGLKRAKGERVFLGIPKRPEGMAIPIIVRNEDPAFGEWTYASAAVYRKEDLPKTPEKR